MLGWVVAVAAWESCWWLRRVAERKIAYERAVSQAIETGLPLLVVGAPDSGMTSVGYGCGDVTIDIAPSVCPRHIQADITEGIPLPDDSVVVLVSCVLECVSDFGAAMKEIRRVGRDRVHVVRTEPWTLTAFFYPGTKRLVTKGTP